MSAMYMVMINQTNKTLALISLSFVCACGQPCEGDFVLDDTGICVKQNQYSISQYSIEQIVNLTLDEYSNRVGIKNIYDRINNETITMRYVSIEHKIFQPGATGATRYNTSLGHITSIDVFLPWIIGNDYDCVTIRTTIHEILHIALYLDLGKSYYDSLETKGHPDNVYGKDQMEDQIAALFDCK